MVYCCGVVFPGSSRACYYYRTRYKSLPLGTRVVVPVGPNSLRKIGRVAFVRGYHLRDLPLPLSEIKWIVGLATPSSERQVESHNIRTEIAAERAERKRQRKAETERSLAWIDRLEEWDALFND